MVEPSAQHRQPQEQVEDFHLSQQRIQIEQIELNFQHTQAEVTQGIKKLEDFKREVSQDLIDLYQRADIIKEKFTKFAKADENKINDQPVFTFNDEFYT